MPCRFWWLETNVLDALQPSPPGLNFVLEEIFPLHYCLTREAPHAIKRVQIEFCVFFYFPVEVRTFTYSRLTGRFRTLSSQPGMSCTLLRKMWHYSVPSWPQRGGVIWHLTTSESQLCNNQIWCGENAFTKPRSRMKETAYIYICIYLHKYTYLYGSSEYVE